MLLMISFIMIDILVLPIALSIALSCIVGLAYAIYNLYFHPYAKHPGPFLARISPFYSLWHAYVGDLHIDVLQCHEKYGKYNSNKLFVAMGALICARHFCQVWT